MNYDAPATPRPQNYGRFSSRFYFMAGTGLNPLAPPATGSWLDLGNCTASQQKHGSKSVAVMRARRGSNVRVDDPVTDVSPEMDITINEVRARKAIPLRIFGTQIADAAQAAAPTGTITFPAVYQNLSYDLGARNVSNVVVKIGATAQTQDVDYQVDPVLGIVTIMEGAIPDSTPGTPSPITVTFAAPALTRAAFQEYTQLNAYGLLRWFLEDTYSGAAAIEKIAYCNVRAQDLGANDPGKYAEDKLTAVITGTVYSFHRKD